MMGELQLPPSSSYPKWSEVGDGAQRVQEVAGAAAVHHPEDEHFVVQEFTRKPTWVAAYE